MKYLDNLLDLGLTLNEARIYEALIYLKEGSIDAISKKADIHRRNVYDTLERLQQKGLIYQISSSKTLLYAPVHPEKLNEIVEQQKNSLDAVLPGLTKAFEAKESKQYSAIYKGVGGLRSFIRLILKEGKDVYGIGSKGTWFDPRLKRYAKKYKEIYDKKGIKSKLIYDYEMRDHKEVIDAIGEDFRYLPKDSSTKSSVDIFGDYVAVYSGVNIKALDDEISIFIIKDDQLAKDYRIWFELLWKLLPKD